MKFVATELQGLMLVQPERLADERGDFARTYCARAFAEHGLEPRFVQCSVSRNPRAGTLRGLHFQVAPHEEAKLVRTAAGSIFDVAVDLRPESASYLRWFGVELSAANGWALYIPAGFAHGFQTLAPDTEVFYMMSADYVAEAARGVRWDDPTLAIAWPPAAHRIISGKDRALPGVAT